VHRKAPNTQGRYDVKLLAEAKVKNEAEPEKSWVIGAVTGVMPIGVGVAVGVDAVLLINGAENKIVVEVGTELLMNGAETRLAEETGAEVLMDGARTAFAV
jgi:hypothetical protein